MPGNRHSYGDAVAVFKMIQEKEKGFEALLKQCESIDSKITSYHLLGARVLAVGTALTVGLLGLALEQELEEVLIALPVAMFTVLVYWLNINIWILSHGGYKKHIEERINEIVGGPVFLWESRIVQKQHINLTNLSLDLVYTAVLVVSIVISIDTALDMESKTVVYWVVGGNVALVTLLIVNLVYAKKSFTRTYRRSVDIFDEESRKMTANKAMESDA